MPEGWICQFERVEWRREEGGEGMTRGPSERWKCVRCGRLIKVSCHCSLYSQIPLMVHRIMVQSLYWFKPVLEQNGGIYSVNMVQSVYWFNFCWTKPRNHYMDWTVPLSPVPLTWCCRGWLDQSFLISFRERDLWRPMHPVFVGDSPFCRFD